MTVSKTGSHNPFAFVREDGPNLAALAPDGTTFLPTETRALPAFSAKGAERERI
jgi:hypothetical protein